MSCVANSAVGMSRPFLVPQHWQLDGYFTELKSPWTWGWTLAEETRSPPIAEEIEQIVSSHPESLQTQTENGPTASGAASIHKASQVIRAEPGATADGARDTGL